MTPESAASEIATALTQAWNAHDAKAFTAPFAADANFTNVFGIEFAGRDQIERLHATIFSTMFRDSTLAVDAPHVRALSQELAAVALRWSMRGAYDPQGNPWPVRHGLMNMILAAHSGAWEIVVFTNMDLPPPEQVAAMQNRLAAGAK